MELGIMDAKKTESPNKIESDASVKIYRYLIITALIVHVLHFGFFLWLGYPLLYLYNIIDVIFFLGIYQLVKKNKIVLAYSLAHAEIFCYIILINITVGWEFGFQFVIFTLLGFSYFNPYKKTQVSKYIVMAFVLLLIALSLLRGVLPYDATFYKEHQWIIKIGSIVNGGMALFTILVTIIYSNLMDVYNKYELRLENDKLHEKIKYDELTGLLTREAFVKRLEMIHADYLERQSIYSIVFADIDFFKQINDSYGHKFGDVVLKKVADTIQNELRKVDFIARWGGEEFVMVLVDSKIEESRMIAERIRQRVNEIRLSQEQNQVGVTLTMGIIESNEGKTPAELIEQADELMYKGKQAGRNRVVSS